MDVFNLNVGQLQTWAAGNSARDYSIVYITFTNASTTNANRDYPAVRIINGATLRAPITIATDRPLYIQGNYNTIGWQPASFIADALTILSNAWNDGTGSHPVPTSGTNSNAGGGSDRTNPAKSGASATTVYAAIAAGHSATPCDWQRSGCSVPTPPPATSGGSYGGGLENFPRFLENWNGIAMVYRGSLVSLFQSRYAVRRRWAWTCVLRRAEPRLGVRPPLPRPEQPPPGHPGGGQRGPDVVPAGVLGWPSPDATPGRGSRSSRWSSSSSSWAWR